MWWMIRIGWLRGREFYIIHVVYMRLAHTNLFWCYRSGGITITNGTGKIDINNTFDERLKLLETDALPSVRATLFGENPNRKFRD